MDVWLFIALVMQLTILGTHAHLVRAHDDEDRGVITSMMLVQLFLLFVVAAVYFGTAWPIGAMFNGTGR